MELHYASVELRARRQALDSCVAINSKSELALNEDSIISTVSVPMQLNVFPRTLEERKKAVY